MSVRLHEWRAVLGFLLFHGLLQKHERRQRGRQHGRQRGRPEQQHEMLQQLKHYSYSDENERNEGVYDDNIDVTLE